METIWFILWGLLWAIYFILDGFDLGLAKKQFRAGVFTGTTADLVRLHRFLLGK